LCSPLLIHVCREGALFFVVGCQTIPRIQNRAFIQDNRQAETCGGIHQVVDHTIQRVLLLFFSTPAIRRSTPPSSEGMAIYGHLFKPAQPPTSYYSREANRRMQTGRMAARTRGKHVCRGDLTISYVTNGHECHTRLTSPSA
jgi:hypothetical protein